MAFHLSLSVSQLVSEAVTRTRRSISSEQSETRVSKSVDFIGLTQVLLRVIRAAL